MVTLLHVYAELLRKAAQPDLSSDIAGLIDRRKQIAERGRKYALAGYGIIGVVFTTAIDERALGLSFGFTAIPPVLMVVLSVISAELTKAYIALKYADEALVVLRKKLSGSGADAILSERGLTEFCNSLVTSYPDKAVVRLWRWHNIFGRMLNGLSTALFISTLLILGRELFNSNKAMALATSAASVVSFLVIAEAAILKYLLLNHRLTAAPPSAS